jgi:hypothetical protein
MNDTGRSVSIGRPELRASQLAFVGAGICLLLAQLMVRPPYSHWGPDYYWATYWVANYSEGICRRCALGTALSALGPYAGDYGVIRVLAWMVLAGLWSVSLLLLERVLRPFPSDLRYLLLVGLALSPSWGGLLIEVIGDPLQVGFLIVLLLLASGRRWGMALWALTGLVVVLIHEATGLFVLAALVTLLILGGDRSPVRLHELGACAAGVAIAMAAMSLFGNTVNFGHARMTVSPGRSLGLKGINPDSLATFGELWHEDWKKRADFGFAFMTGGFIGATILPVLQSLLFCRFVHTAFALDRPWTESTLRLWLVSYVLPWGLTLPLWLIAHDWARFAGYTLIVQTCVLCIVLRTVAVSKRRATAPLRWALIIQSVLLVLCTSPTLTEYRVLGVWNTGYFLLAIVAAGIAVALAFRHAAMALR